MITKLLSLLELSKDSKADSRRRYTRHICSSAEAMLGERIYNIRDWSMGGLCVDSALQSQLQPGDQVPVILKFRFTEDTITVRQMARIVRADTNDIAAEFVQVEPSTRRQFERVLDNIHAQSFLTSQIA